MAGDGLLALRRPGVAAAPAAGLNGADPVLSAATASYWMPRTATNCPSDSGIFPESTSFEQPKGCTDRRSSLQTA